MISNWLGVAAGGLTIVAYLPYIVSVFKRKSQPDVVTWLVLTIIGSVSFITYYSLGARATLFLAAANAVCPLLIFLLAFFGKRGYRASQSYYYLLASLAAIVFWYFTGDPLLALALNLIADFLGFLPTIRKSWILPFSENLSAWKIFVFAAFVNLLAVNELSLGTILYPTYIFLAESSLLFILLYRRRQSIGLIQ
jgi:hypothetical protein